MARRHKNKKESQAPITPEPSLDSEPKDAEIVEEPESLPKEWPNFDAWRREQGMLQSAGGLQANDVPRDEMGRILPGHSLNPYGRQPGSENFKTIFEKALKEVARINNIDPEDLHAQIVSKGIQLASKGDFRFYKDLLDRLYGKPKEKIGMDLTTGGLPIQGGNQITFVDFSGKGKQNASEDQS